MNHSTGCSLPSSASTRAASRSIPASTSRSICSGSPFRSTVSDFEKWHQAYKDVANFQKENGVTAEAVFQNADDPNDITVIHDFATVDEAKAFAADLDALFYEILPETRPQNQVANI